jgi:hypothetical protein
MAKAGEGLRKVDMRDLLAADPEVEPAGRLPRSKRLKAKREGPGRSLIEGLLLVCQ